MNKKIYIILVIGISFLWLQMQDIISSNTCEDSSVYSRVLEGYKLAKSVAFFHVSILYNKLRYGNAFSFNQIAGDISEKTILHKNGISIEQDMHGNIINVHDGKKTPLVLSSIPRNEANITTLKNAFTIADQDKIGLYTLNRQFECDWSGLSKLVRDNKNIQQFNYPTTDYGAPSFINLLRAVYDIDHRDEYGYKVACVHCKAGRGRSAVTIAAYLAHVFNKAGIEVIEEQIINYIKLCRPQISLNYEHRTALSVFIKALREAGSFDALYSLHKEVIENDISSVTVL